MLLLSLLLWISCRCEAKYLLQSGSRHKAPNEMCPIKGMENNCAYLVGHCTSLFQLHPLSAKSPLSLSSTPFFPLLFYSFFMTAIVPFHHIIGWKRTLTLCWLSKSSTWFDWLKAHPHWFLWVVKQRSRSLLYECTLLLFACLCQIFGTNGIHWLEQHR